MITIISPTVTKGARIDNRPLITKIKDFLSNTKVEHKYKASGEFLIQGQPVGLCRDAVLLVPPGVEFQITEVTTLPHTTIVKCKAVQPLYEFEIAELNTYGTLHAVLNQDGVLYIE